MCRFPCRYIPFMVLLQADPYIFNGLQLFNSSKCCEALTNFTVVARTCGRERVSSPWKTVCVVSGDGVGRFLQRGEHRQTRVLVASHLNLVAVKVAADSLHGLQNQTVPLSPSVNMV